MEIKGRTFLQSFFFIEESKKAPNMRKMQQGCNFSSWACTGEREAQWQSSWEDNQWSSTGTPAHAIYAQRQTPANRKILMKRCFRPVSTDTFALKLLSKSWLYKSVELSRHHNCLKVPEIEDSDQMSGSIGKCERFWLMGRGICRPSVFLAPDILPLVTPDIENYKQKLKELFLFMNRWLHLMYGPSGPSVLLAPDTGCHQKHQVLD